ncbi:hypothetical protein RUM44_007294 [Polyplax serrata]|uniref:Uncharacterized protein n=1 Tax=Polyplax serrata TaxID=468196 RepID=A0ABR1B0A2_POLSC
MTDQNNVDRLDGWYSRNNVLRFRLCECMFFVFALMKRDNAYECGMTTTVPVLINKIPYFKNVTHVKLNEKRLAFPVVPPQVGTGKLRNLSTNFQLKQENSSGVNEIETNSTNKFLITIYEKIRVRE